jgi:hypothetical protein
MAASRAAVVAAATNGRAAVHFEKLLCGSVADLASRLRPRTRIAGLDITQTHLSISVSDRDRRQAVPFGVLARCGSATDDARALSRAIAHAHTADPRGSLDLAALVVGAPPGEEAGFEYVEALMRHGEDDEEIVPPFPGLDGILFYSEAEAVRRALLGVEDFVRGVKLLPPRLESRKFGRFDTAMNPAVDATELVDDLSARARISASEVLQAVLDDLARVGDG